jgi:hypothetical protein
MLQTHQVSVEMITALPAAVQDPISDQFRGANLIISCKDGGEDVKVVQVSMHDPL